MKMRKLTRMTIMLDIVGFDSVSEVVMMMIVTMNCKCVDEDARISIKVHSDGDGDGDSQECAMRQSVFFWSPPKFLFLVLILKTPPTSLLVEYV